MAHFRQVSTTSHRRHTALASSIWSSAGPVFPMGKNSSGSSSRQAARLRQVIRLDSLGQCSGGSASGVSVQQRILSVSLWQWWFAGGGAGSQWLFAVVVHRSCSVAVVDRWCRFVMVVHSGGADFWPSYTVQRLNMRIVLTNRRWRAPDCEQRIGHALERPCRHPCSNSHRSEQVRTMKSDDLGAHVLTSLSHASSGGR